MKARNEMTADEVDNLRSSLARRLGDTAIPSLPQVAIKSITLVSDPNSTIQQFAEVISSDQALTGRLLRMANSSAFGQRGGVTDVRRAMILLGLERLKALALGFHLSMASVTDRSTYGFRSMWTQSLFRGCVAMRLAERIKKERSGEAFIIGFLCDAGIPTMPELVGDAYPNDTAIAGHPTRLHATEYTKFHCTHVDVVGAMARIWNLPDRLTKPIEAHHTRPSGCDFKNTQSLLHALAYFVGNIPLTPEGTISESTVTAREAQRLFELDDKALLQLFADAAQDFGAFRTLFGDVIDPSMTADAILDEANKQAVDEDQLSDDEGVVVNAGSMILTLTRTGGDKVSVAVVEAGGEAMVSEDVDPHALTDDDLRSRLLIDDATNDELAQLRSAITELAA